MHSGWQSDNLSSFENFKMQTMKGISDNQAYIPDDEELMKMYESAKQDKLETAEHRVNRNLTVNRLILVIAVVLFIIHWIMMRRAMKASNS